MPALPPVPGVLRHLLFWTVGLDTTVSTRLFLSFTGPSPTSDILAPYAAAALTSAATNLCPLVNPANTLTGINVVDLTTASGGEGAATGTHPGTRLGGILPAGACALQNLVVARRYRGGKPRRYWPFGSDNDLGNAQEWGSGFTNAAAAGIAAWISALFASPPSGTTLQQQVNVSYYSGYLPPTILPSGAAKNHSKPRTAAEVDVIVSGRINPRLGSQRRRIAA